MVHFYEEFWLSYALGYLDRILIRVQFFKVFFSLFGGLRKEENTVLGRGVSDGKVTAPFLHKPHRQAVHRIGVVANRIT